MTLHWFAGYGIELEYMIVHRETLDVLPIADVLLEKAGGPGASDVERGDIGWSNELVLHVLEFKTNGPAAKLEGVSRSFEREIRYANGLLEERGGMLLPTAMHPWMDPWTETRLWPHDNGIIYRTFDRIFSCRGHGWSNLQSMHINLPFEGDEEFGRLHAAIRIVLPLLPALAASSPIHDGKRTGILDNRLVHYRRNATRVPEVAGQIVPERVFDKATYEGELLEGIYRVMAPHDPQGVLRHEWLNARGAIARFDRNAIEIRLLDVQECPRADLAIAAAVVAVVRALALGRWSTFEEQKAWEPAPLRSILDKTTERGGETWIEDTSYLRLFSRRAPGMRARDLWRELVTETLFQDPAAKREHEEPLQLIWTEGTLARRILRSLPELLSRHALTDVYRRLATCLAENVGYHV